MRSRFKKSGRGIGARRDCRAGLSIMAIFQKRAIQSESKKRDMPEGLWQKCPNCGEVTHNLVLDENQRVCPKCEHHFTQNARERIAGLVDPESFSEHDANMISVDILKFKGM